jgi:hypothetical protein
MDCSICFEPYKQGNKATYLLGCGHTFCLNCIDKMNNKCGMCRTKFTSKIKMFIVYDDNHCDNEKYTNKIIPFDGFNTNFNTNDFSTI